MATFDKSKRVDRYNNGNIRQTIGGGFVGEIYSDHRLHRSKTESTKAEARAWIDRWWKERKAKGEKHSKLTGTQTDDALAALEHFRNEKQSVSMLEAARFYTRHHKATGEAWTVAETLARYLDHLEHPQDGSSKARERTVENKRNRLKSFVEAHGGRKVPEVTEGDVKAWLESTGAEERNLRNYKIELQSLFNFAADQEREDKMPGGYVNTVARYKFKKKKEVTPAEIVEPRHVKAVLHWLEGVDPAAAVGYAIACFAGLRTAELCSGEGLQWDDIDFDEGVIEVPESLSKTRKARPVNITPNLMQWLVRYRQKSGRVTRAVGMFASRRRQACRATGAVWPDNGARHSFGTYFARLHGHRNAADELGHVGGIKMLEDHYRGKCTKEKAEEFFQIVPATKGKIIQHPARATA